MLALAVDTMTVLTQGTGDHASIVCGNDGWRRLSASACALGPDRLIGRARDPPDWML